MRRSRLFILAALVAMVSVGPAQAETRNIISRIHVDSKASTTEVRIVGTRAPNFTQFTLESPNRVVVDLSQAVLAGPPAELPGQGPVLTNLRTAMFTDDSVSVARITLELAGATPYKVDVDGHDLVLRLKGTDGARTLARASRDDHSRCRVEDLARAEAARAQAESARAEAERQASLAERRASDAEAALAHAQQERDVATRELTEAQKARRTSEQSLSEALAARDAVRAELEALKEGNAATRSELETRLAETTTRLAELERRAREAIASRQQVEARAQELKTASASAADRAADAERALQELRDAREAAEARARDEAEARAELAVQVEALKARQKVLADAQAGMQANQRYAYAQDAGAPEGSYSVSNGPKVMQRVGFHADTGRATIVVRTNQRVRYSISEQGDSLILELENTRAATWNDLNHLDTRFFNGPVQLIDPEEIEGAGSHIRIHIVLSQRWPYEVQQDDTEIRVVFTSPTSE